MHLTKNGIISKIKLLEEEEWELLFVDCVSDFGEDPEVLEVLKEETSCWLNYYKQQLKELEKENENV